MISLLTTKKWSFLILLIASVYVLTGCVPTMSKDGPIQDPEYAFLLNAGFAQRYEINSSRIAIKSAKDKKVQEYAKLLVEQQSDAYRKLAKIAEKKSLYLPISCDDHQQKVIEKLEALENADFEKAYIQAKIEAQEKMLALYSDALRNNNQALKNYAESEIPVIKQNIQSAHSLKEHLHPSSIRVANNLSKHNG